MAGVLLGTYRDREDSLTPVRSYRIAATVRSGVPAWRSIVQVKLEAVVELEGTQLRGFPASSSFSIPNYRRLTVPPSWSLYPERYPTHIAHPRAEVLRLAPALVL